MNRKKVLELIFAAIHSLCGGGNCGAEDMHMDEAREVLSSLESAGVVNFHPDDNSGRE